MANKVPLYTASREYARAHDEIPLWRESINENIRCKQAIEDAIRQSFDGMHLKPDCAESVIQEFGCDRVEYVIGNTLQQLKYDGRFSWSNKEWGENIEIPDDYRNCEFCVGSHPAVLDGFITEYRKAAEEQKQDFKKKYKSASAKPTPPRKTFLDMIAPGVMKFNPDVYIRDNLYCCVWALKEYPAATEDQAILRHLGEKCGVNIRIYTRIVDAMEENRIIQNATNKNRLSRANTNDTKQMITAEGNLQDVFEMVNAMRKRREPLIHCAVFIELCAPTMQELERLQSEVISELLRSKLNVDRLRLRQQKGYLSTCPQGHNIFGTQFERVLPASSVANLYIYNYSGKTDAHGFYIGKDRYGSNILTDFDQRDEDKTSANVLILGNSGQGKSYLMKLLMVNCREAGKNIISLDVEHEQGELCSALDGCFIDLMGGQYIINVLEPKCWSTGEDEDDPSTPETFKKKTVLSQHLSFLRDFFRAYKDFTDPQIDTIEILLSKLYSKFHMPNAPQCSEYRTPPPESVAACMVRMLHHMGNIFQDNVSASGYRGLQLDRKRRKELQEWKIALGHREGDHEDPANYPKPAY